MMRLLQWLMVLALAALAGKPIAKLSCRPF